MWKVRPVIVQRSPGSAGSQNGVFTPRPTAQGPLGPLGPRPATGAPAGADGRARCERHGSCLAECRPQRSAKRGPRARADGSVAGEGAHQRLVRRALPRRGRAPWRARAPATGPTTSRAHAGTCGHATGEACGARARCGDGCTGVPAAGPWGPPPAAMARRRQAEGPAGAGCRIGKARWSASCPGVCKFSWPRLACGSTGRRGRARACECAHRAARLADGLPPSGWVRARNCSARATMGMRADRFGRRKRAAIGSRAARARCRPCAGRKREGRTADGGLPARRPCNSHLVQLREAGVGAQLSLTGRSGRGRPAAERGACPGGGGRDRPRGEMNTLWIEILFLVFAGQRGGVHKPNGAGVLVCGLNPRAGKCLDSVSP